MSSIEIKHAILYETVGRTRQWGRFAFVPAHAEIFELQDCGPKYDAVSFFQQLGHHCPDIPFQEYQERLWVRARFPRVFGFSPIISANNYSPIVDVAFFAVAKRQDADDFIAWPFVCTVVYHSNDDLKEDPMIGLLFSKLCTNSELKQEIADAFWTLLNEEPQGLEYFSDYEFHAESGNCFYVGIDRSGYFSEWIVDEGKEHWNSHYGFPTGTPRICHDCDGSGIENMFPFTDDCGTCGGTGVVSW